MFEFTASATISYVSLDKILKWILFPHLQNSGNNSRTMGFYENPVGVQYVQSALFFPIYLIFDEMYAMMYTVLQIRAKCTCAITDIVIIIIVTIISLHISPEQNLAIKNKQLEYGESLGFFLDNKKLKLKVSLS